MSRRLLFWIVSWLAIGMSACTTLRPAYVRSHLNTAKACADWRWIGISRPEVQCPEIPGWKVRPLFPQLAPAPRKSDDYCDRNPEDRGDYCEEKKSEDVLDPRPDPRLIQELNRFCVYEPDPKNIFKKPKLPPGASGDLVRLDQDCVAFSIADTELKEEYLEKGLESNYENFPAEAGQPGASLQNNHAP